MTDVIVLASIAFAAVFTVVWLLRPGLRAWIEKPKYRFLCDVQTYDQARKAEAGAGPASSSEGRPH